ncbi:hypothetical protein AAHZ94_33045, partial [Streptomyces sp. HSW2009]|uniref:hypothetical protein n=1 Tax=Streptomyces sp. HSW2009 TaxID=3142890 RepID=UPI0032ECFBCC
MTAPLTPSDQPPPTTGQQPYPGHPGGAHAAQDAGRAGTGPGKYAEFRDAAIITAALTAVGAVLAVLWAWLAPRVQMVLIGNSVYPKNSESEEVIGGDGTFLLIALGVGLVSTAVVFCFRRSGGVPLVVALTVGGLLGSWVGWRFGIVLGPETDLAVSAREAGERVPFDGPLELKAKGVLLAWPVAAMVMQLILTGLFGPRDPEPEHAAYAPAPAPAPAEGAPAAPTGEGQPRPGGARPAPPPGPAAPAPPPGPAPPAGAAPP